MNHWFFIVNPYAQSGRAAQEWIKIRHELDEQKFVYEFALTEHPFHAPELVKKALALGFRKIVAVGGDGTINEVVNGIFLQKEVPSTEIEFSVIPAGTGSDWARTYQLSKNYKKAIAKIKEGENTFQDVGLVRYKSHLQMKERYFVNVAGMAYDAYVTDKLIDMPRGGLSGEVYYLLAVLRCMKGYQAMNMHIKGDNFEFKGNAFCLNVGICKYSGGGMQLVPEAIHNDGLFDVTIIEDLSFLKVLRNIPRLYSGNIYNARQAKHFRTKSLSVTSDISQLEVEGELLGTAPFEFTILPNALNVRA